MFNLLQWKHNRSNRFNLESLYVKVSTVELQCLAHWWLVYHGCFELVLESLEKKSHSWRFKIFLATFFCLLKIVNCMYSSESHQWGNSNENTQHTFILRKIENISLWCFLIWRHDLNSLARTTSVSNIFSWFQRCSSHWSSTVQRLFCKTH